VPLTLEVFEEAAANVPGTHVALLSPDRSVVRPGIDGALR
jgi:hypothetical protein